MISLLSPKWFSFSTPDKSVSGRKTSVPSLFAITLNLRLLIYAVSTHNRQNLAEYDWFKNPCCYLVARLYLINVSRAHKKLKFHAESAAQRDQLPDYREPLSDVFNFQSGTWSACARVSHRSLQGVVRWETLGTLPLAFLVERLLRILENRRVLVPYPGTLLKIGKRM